MADDTDNSTVADGLIEDGSDYFKMKTAGGVVTLPKAGNEGTYQWMKKFADGTKAAATGSDQVSAKLSPNEIVIPTSITQHEHAPYLAAEFVRKVLAGKGPAPQSKDGKPAFAGGGFVPDFSGLLPADAPLLTGMPASQYDAQQAASAPMNPGTVGPPAPYDPTPAYDPLAGTGLSNQQVPQVNPDTGIPSMIENPDNPALGAQGSTTAGATGAPPAARQPPGGGPAGLDGYSPFAPRTTHSEDTSTTTAGPAATQAIADFTDAANTAKKDSIARDDQLAKDALMKAGAIADVQQAFQTSMTAWQKERDDGVKQMTSDIQAKTAEYNNMKLDSNRLFGADGTGNRVLASLGLAFGAIGNALSMGNHNYSNDIMGIINNAIDRDVNEQRFNMEKSKNVIDMKRGALHDYMDVTKDKNTAETAERARQLEWASNQAEIFANKAENFGPIVKANADQVVLKTRQELMNTQAQLSKSVQNVKDETMQPRPEPPPSGVVDKVQSLAKSNAALSRIDNLLDVVSTGPGSEKWRQLKGQFGYNDKDDTEFQQLMTKQLADTAEESGAGGRAFSSAELPTMQKMTLSGMIASKEAIRNIIHENQKLNAAEMQNYRETYPLSPLPIERFQARYNAAYPENNAATAASVGFKPAVKKPAH